MGHDAEVRVRTVVDTKDFSKLNGAIQKLKTGLGKVSTSMKKLGSIVGNVFKGIGTAIGNFVKSFTTAFLKMGVIATLVMMVKKGIEMLKEGLENFAQASPEYNKTVSAFKSELEQLKNSLASAFAPIIQAVIPYLTQFINWLNRALDYVAQFFAVLTGKNSYLKAKKQAVDYAKGLKKVQKETKNLQLAGIDELNVLQSQSEAMDDSDISPNGAVGGALAFEEVAIDESKFKWVDWLREHLGLIKELAKDIGLLFLGWTFGGSIGLLISGIALLVSGIKEWIETGELSDEVFARLELGIIAVSIALGLLTGSWIPLLVGAIVGLALAIYKHWDEIKAWTIEMVEKIKEKFKDLWEKLKSGVSNFISTVKEKFNNFKTTIVNIFTSIKNTLSNIWNSIWSTIKGIINKILGGIEKMVNGVISGINFLLKGINLIANGVGSLLGLDPINLELNPISLPRLATGGIVTEPTRALIGEAGKEAVLPLESNTEWMDALAERIGQNMEVTFQVEGDPNGLFKVIRKEATRYTQRTGLSSFA